MTCCGICLFREALSCDRSVFYYFDPNVNPARLPASPSQDMFLLRQEKYHFLYDIETILFPTISLNYELNFAPQQFNSQVIFLLPLNCPQELDIVLPN